MELLLNEKSLDGQFATIEEFYDMLPVMSRNLELLQEQKILLMKHSAVYSRKITQDMTIYDLNNRTGSITPIYRDKVRKWKRELARLVTDPPFWDMDAGAETDVLAEAGRRGTDILSFYHKDYLDRRIKIIYCGQTIEIGSAVTTGYLADMLLGRGWIHISQYLMYKYEKGRLSFQHFSRAAKSTETLQKIEIQELLDALNRFEMAGSWEDICHDRFFDYKKYQPSSRKADYFSETPFADKDIDKFRCGQHSQVRCFGFREKDQFFVIALERDHSISDTG